MIDNLNGQKEEIKVNLKVDSNEEFFRGEKISLSKSRYGENSLKPIKDSNKSITSNFDINGFDFGQLTYTCVKGSEITNVSQTYYFGTKFNDYTQNKTENISTNNTSIKVNCSSSYLNVGYLKEVKYNETHVNVSFLEFTDSSRGKFTRERNYISFAESEDGTTKIRYMQDFGWKYYIHYNIC